jgi:enoyl-CoA hydratase/carnithine racemase
MSRLIHPSAVLIAAACLLQSPAALAQAPTSTPPQAAAPATSAAATAANSINIEVVSPRIRRVVFSNPPANLIAPEVVSRLHQVIKELADDANVQVVIFTSSTPKFYFNHFDLTQAARFPMLPGEPASPAWVDMVLRLSKAPFISIAAIRGRTRGGGNELALAMDLRYASQEQAFFSQPEVGTGIVPGGGGSERLPRLIGRDRALEAILGSQDYDATTAERYGWVTRTLPDAELDAFVMATAERLAKFDRAAITVAKSQINRATLPPDADLAEAYREYSRSLGSPNFRPRMGQLGKFLAEKGLDVEMRLGDYLGQIGPLP